MTPEQLKKIHEAEVRLLEVIKDAFVDPYLASELGDAVVKIQSVLDTKLRACTRCGGRRSHRIWCTSEGINEDFDAELWQKMEVKE